MLSTSGPIVPQSHGGKIGGEQPLVVESDHSQSRLPEKTQRACGAAEGQNPVEVHRRVRGVEEVLEPETHPLHREAKRRAACPCRGADERVPLGVPSEAIENDGSVPELHEDPHDATNLNPVQHVRNQEVPLRIFQLPDCAVRFRPFAEDQVRPNEIDPALAKLGLSATAEGGQVLGLVVLGAKRYVSGAETVH
jgi:hypothetical protein